MDSIEIERYLNYLKGRNPNTAKRYTASINNLRKYAVSDDKINTDLVNEYLGTFRKEIRGTSMPTRSSIVYAYAIVDMFKFVGDKDVRYINVPTGVLIEDNPAYLFKDDIDDLIKHTKGCIRPAIALSHDLALRFGECAMLERSDFNHSSLKCRVIRLKQKNPTVHILNVNKNVAEIIKEYTSKRRDSSPYLFTTDSQHKQLSINQQMEFPKICKNLNIEDRAESGLKSTWHILRHTRLTWMIADGRSIEETAKFAGHRNTSSTLKYLNIAVFNGLGIYDKTKGSES